MPYPKVIILQPCLASTVNLGGSVVAELYTPTQNAKKKHNSGKPLETLKTPKPFYFVSTPIKTRLIGFILTLIPCPM